MTTMAAVPTTAAVRTARTAGGMGQGTARVHLRPSSADAAPAFTRVCVPRRASGAPGAPGRARYPRRCRSSASIPSSRPPRTSRRRSPRSPTGVRDGERYTTLLGATGTGKTMTMAGVDRASCSGPRW